MLELNWSDSRVWTRLASVAMLLALVVALLPGHPAAPAIALGIIGALTAVAVTALPAARAVWRRRSLLVVPVLATLLIAWAVVGLIDATGNWTLVSGAGPDGAPLHPYGYFYSGGATAWPWHLGRLPLWALVLALICAVGGFVLVTDAVRVQIGLGRPSRVGWRALGEAPSRGGKVAVRALPGVVLIIAATLLGIGLVDGLTDDHPVYQSVGVVIVVAGAALLVIAPVGIGLTLRVDFDKEAHARDQERQRFAAHLHDSVLQTLALIQRQAADPDAVGRLARRQEHALRAWMAGEADLGTATVALALRDMITEMEEESGLKVELTAAGDATLDARGEELIAAGREALRNVARHAPGAPVNVFLDAGPAETSLFIRDSGPGFAFDQVPAERRGLRDAVIGRMRSVGGSATVESVLGEGTEIALVLPQRKGRSGR